MHWAGWERLVNWQTFLAADVNGLSQNTLNVNQIGTPGTIWEVICLDKGGPQMADLGGQNHNSWGRNSSSTVQGEPHKGDRRTRMPLLPHSGSNTIQMNGSRACWPQGHIPDILPSVSDVLQSYTGQMSSSQPVCGRSWVSESKQDDRLISLFFPTSRLGLRFEPRWITPYESLWRSSIYNVPEVYLDSDAGPGKITSDPAGLQAVYSFKVRLSEGWEKTNSLNSHVRQEEEAYKTSSHQSPIYTVHPPHKQYFYMDSGSQVYKNDWIRVGLSMRQLQPQTQTSFFILLWHYLKHKWSQNINKNKHVGNTM